MRTAEQVQVSMAQLQPGQLWGHGAMTRATAGAVGSLLTANQGLPQNVFKQRFFV